MRAAVLRGIKKIKIEEMEKPKLLEHEALVQIKSVGICGSDVHYFRHGRIGNQVVRGPHILGHEPSGIVVSVGKEVARLAPGMRVAVEPGVPCGKCEHCKSGRYNICPDVKFLGTPPYHGAFREFLAWPTHCLFPVPENMSFDEAGLVETYAVGDYAVELAGLKKGESIAIIGCGPIGISTLKAARLAGVKQIFAIDLIKERLDFVSKYTEVTAIHPPTQDLFKEISRLTRKRGVDVVFEAAGARETLGQAVEIARVGGRVVWIGIPQVDNIEIPAHISRRKELVIKCVRRYKNNYPRCIKDISSGKVEIKDIITHRFPLDQIEQGFKLVEKYRDGVIKAVIEL